MKPSAQSPAELLSPGHVLTLANVAADYSEADCRRLRPRSDRSRKVGNDKTFGALRDVRKRQHMAGAQQFSGGLC